MSAEEVVWVQQAGPPVLTMAPEPLHLTRGLAQRGLIRVSLPRITWGPLMYAHEVDCPVVFRIGGGQAVTKVSAACELAGKRRQCRCRGPMFRVGPDGEITPP